MEDYQIKVLKDRIKEHIDYCEDALRQMDNATAKNEYAYASGIAKGTFMTLLACLEVTDKYINECEGEE